VLALAFLTLPFGVNLCARSISETSQTEQQSLAAAPAAQEVTPVQVLCDTVLFRFAPGDEIFRAHYKGNAIALHGLKNTIEKHIDEIREGSILIAVRGFQSKDHSNQVKSYFIEHCGVKEENYRTINYSHPWRKGDEDVAAALFLYGAHGEEVPIEIDEEVAKTAGGAIQRPENEAVSEPKAPTETPEPQPQEETQKKPKEEAPSSIATREKNPLIRSFYIKTNVGYLAAAVTNAGVEAAFSEHWSLDIPVIYSPYTVARNYRLRFLAVQPEVRYYFTRAQKGHFLGLEGSVGVANVSRDNTNRYQTPKGFYGGGLVYGYCLPFGKQSRWSAEFSIAAGYIYARYDTYYNIDNGAMKRESDCLRYWGPTKVGIGIVYRLGGGKDK